MRELITSNDWKLKKNKKYLGIVQWCFIQSNYSLDKNIKNFLHLYLILKIPKNL